jgi:hypothetical protein
MHNFMRKQIVAVMPTHCTGRICNGIKVRNLPALEGRRGHFIPGEGSEMASWGERKREVVSEIELNSYRLMNWIWSLGQEFQAQSPDQSGAPAPELEFP